MNAMQKNQAMVSRSDDRPDDSLAVSRMFNSATPVKRYSPIAKLSPKQETLPENLQKAILKKQGEDPDTALPRKNKFCGGASKPYGKKK